MTNYVFETPGVLEHEAFTVMGLSVKDTDNPIGYFGTGLKYAFAVIMRLGGSVNIKAPGYHAQLRLEEGTFRGTEYTRLMCDFLDTADNVTSSMPLPYTTDYGKNWKPWMAFRELYSNTLDEGGSWYKIGDNKVAVSPHGEGTCITVNCKEFAEVDLNFNDYFMSADRFSALQDAGLVVGADFKHSHVVIIKAGNGRVFWRGVRVHENNNFPYDIVVSPNRKIGLTEDRAAGYWDAEALYTDCVAALICSTDDVELLTAYAESNDKNNPALGNIKTMLYHDTQVHVHKQVAADVFDRKNGIPNKWFRTYVIRNRLLSEYFDEADDDDTAELRQKLDDAMSYLGLFSSALADTPTRIVARLPNEVLACVQDDVAVFSAAFVRSASKRELIATAYEEAIHAHYHVSDYTREFQDRACTDVAGALLALKRARDLLKEHETTTEVPF